MKLGWKKWGRCHASLTLTDSSLINQTLDNYNLFVVQGMRFFIFFSYWLSWCQKAWDFLLFRVIVNPNGCWAQAWRTPISVSLLFPVYYISHFPIAMIKGKLVKKGFGLLFDFPWFIGFCFRFCFCLWCFQRDIIDNVGKHMAAGTEPRSHCIPTQETERQNRTWGEAIRLQSLAHEVLPHLGSTSSWFHSLSKQHCQL